MGILSQGKATGILKKLEDRQISLDIRIDKCAEVLDILSDRLLRLETMANDLRKSLEMLSNIVNSHVAGEKA